MRLSLIGMAGSGKSHWSRKLEEHGFTRFCCDDMIAERLAPELKRPDGTSMSVAQWMGFPCEAGYRERETRYLFCEKEVLQEVIEYLENMEGDLEEDVVVDTTGSVIYVDDKLLKKLSCLTTMVLLETPPHIQARLLESYLSHPHPMVWNRMFSQRPGESHLDAMNRCYPLLFSSRTQLYEHYGTVTIGYDERRRKGFSVNDFLNQVI